MLGMYFAGHTIQFNSIISIIYLLDMKTAPYKPVFTDSLLFKPVEFGF